MDALKPKRGRGRPKNSGYADKTAITTTKSLKDPNPLVIPDAKKREFLERKIIALQRLKYDDIVARFGPVLEMIRNGGTIKQAAYAGGMSSDELKLMLDFGRFGGSEHWHSFYEEFYRAKSAHEIGVMKTLQEQAKMGDKWAIERLMNIMDPEEFAAFDVAAMLPNREETHNKETHIHIHDRFSEKEVIEAEVISLDTN